MLKIRYIYERPSWYLQSEIENDFYICENLKTNKPYQTIGELRKDFEFLVAREEKLLENCGRCLPYTQGRALVIRMQDGRLILNEWRRK